MKMDETLNLKKRLYGAHKIFISAIVVFVVSMGFLRLNVNPDIVLATSLVLYSLLNFLVYSNFLSKQKQRLHKISYYIGQLSDGIISTDINLKDFEGSDELNNSLVKISDQFSNISNEIESVNTNILNGNVDLRVLENGRKGCFYDICFNTNNLISSFQWILDSLTIPLVIVNKKSSITYLNKQAAGFIKKQRMKLLNKGFFTYFDLEDAAADDNIIKTCFKTGEILNTKTKIYIENEVKNVYYSVIPIKDDNACITSVLICFIDYMSISGDDFYKNSEDIYFEKRINRLINAVEEYSRYEPTAKSSYLKI